MKKLWSIIAAFWIGGLSAIAARYEAGQRWSAGRSWLPGFVQDARYDADPMTREELVRKSRYFERNNAIVNRLCDLFEQYCVGPNGLQFIPASSDEAWNQRNAAAWAEWCSLCDITSRDPFSTVQSLAARIWFVDGEAYLLKTYGEVKGEAGKPVRRPRIQLIEGHRISTPPAMQAQEGITMIEGIEVDPRGRKIAFWVQDGLEGKTWSRVPADMMIPIGEASRPGMYRPLPFLYPVLNDLHDLDDLQMLTAQVAKRLAAISDVIENEAGEAADSDTVRRQRYNQTTQSSGGTDTDQTRTSYYKQVFGATTKYLKRGDKLNRPPADRPSVAEREHWDYLTSKICAGVGISKLLVFPWSMQGTVTRADLDVQNAFFRSRSAVLQAAFTQVYLWVTDWNTKNILDLSDPPADWRLVTTRAPRSVSVDVGRNSNALIAEYEAGWRTLEGICAEMGEDYRNVLRQRAREFKLAMQIEKDEGLPPGTLIQAVLESLKQQAAQAAAQKAAEAVANPPEAQPA